MSATSRIAMLFKNFTVIFSSMLVGSFLTHEYMDMRARREIKLQEAEAVSPVEPQ